MNKNNYNVDTNANNYRVHGQSRGGLSLYVIPKHASQELEGLKISFWTPWTGRTSRPAPFSHKAKPQAPRFPTWLFQKNLFTRIPIWLIGWGEPYVVRCHENQMKYEERSPSIQALCKLCQLNLGSSHGITELRPCVGLGISNETMYAQRCQCNTPDLNFSMSGRSCSL